MAKNHGARQQKRLAKQKAKRSARRSTLSRFNSKDPAIRLRHVEKLPVVRALVGSELFKHGIGHAVIARQEMTGGVIVAVFLVDVYCLGVKDAFWRAGTLGDLEDLIEKIEESQRMSAIAPACLVKLVKGAVEYAESFGFPPHPDYRHASILLDGIDPSICPTQFEFGRDGRPIYVQGPFESIAESMAITQRVQAAGGHCLVTVSGAEAREFADIEGDFDELESPDEDDSPDDSF